MPSLGFDSFALSFPVSFLTPASGFLFRTGLAGEAFAALSLFGFTYFL
jgi:hypothetical protein